MSLNSSFRKRPEIIFATVISHITNRRSSRSGILHLSALGQIGQMGACAHAPCLWRQMAVCLCSVFRVRFLRMYKCCMKLTLSSCFRTGSASLLATWHDCFTFSWSMSLVMDICHQWVCPPSSYLSSGAASRCCCVTQHISLPFGVPHMVSVWLLKWMCCFLIELNLIGRADEKGGRGRRER